MHLEHDDILSRSDSPPASPAGRGRVHAENSREKLTSSREKYLTRGGGSDAYSYDPPYGAHPRATTGLVSHVDRGDMSSKPIRAPFHPEKGATHVKLDNQYHENDQETLRMLSHLEDRLSEQVQEGRKKISEEHSQQIQLKDRLEHLETKLELSERNREKETEKLNTRTEELDRLIVSMTGMNSRSYAGLELTTFADRFKDQLSTIDAHVRVLSRRIGDESYDRVGAIEDQVKELKNQFHRALEAESGIGGSTRIEHMLENYHQSMMNTKRELQAQGSANQSVLKDEIRKMKDNINQHVLLLDKAQTTLSISDQKLISETLAHIGEQKDNIFKAVEYKLQPFRMEQQEKEGQMNRRIEANERILSEFSSRMSRLEMELDQEREARRNDAETFRCMIEEERKLRHETERAFSKLLETTIQNIGKN